MQNHFNVFSFKFHCVAKIRVKILPFMCLRIDQIGSWQFLITVWCVSDTKKLFGWCQVDRDIQKRTPGASPCIKDAINSLPTAWNSIKFWLVYARRRDTITPRLLSNETFLRLDVSLWPLNYALLHGIPYVIPYDSYVRLSHAHLQPLTSHAHLLVCPQSGHRRSQFCTLKNYWGDSHSL